MGEKLVLKDISPKHNATDSIGHNMDSLEDLGGRILGPNVTPENDTEEKR